MVCPQNGDCGSKGSAICHGPSVRGVGRRTRSSQGFDVTIFTNFGISRILWGLSGNGEDIYVYLRGTRLCANGVSLVVPWRGDDIQEFALEVFVRGRHFTFLSRDHGVTSNPAEEHGIIPRGTSRRDSLLHSVFLSKYS